MIGEERRSRIELSEKLLELAQHLSEAEMRQSISRIYYAAYHAAWVFLGTKYSHQEIASRLEPFDEQLGKDYKSLQNARSKADYDHEWARRFGTLEDFQGEF